MNYKLTISLLALIFSAFAAQAQLKVKPTGNVQVGPSHLSAGDASLDIVGKDATTGTRMYAASADISRFWALNNNFSYGFGVDANGVGQLWRNVNAPSTIMTFNSAGNFGIGRTPYFRLDVNGSMRVNFTVYTSDENMKTNIRAVEAESRKLLDLQAVKYNLKSELKQLEDYQARATDNAFPEVSHGNLNADNVNHFGYLAQDVQKHFPELVYEDEEGVMGIDYVGLIPLMVEELK
ncbi:MAG: tail fiber domain-containing protein, partial [Bacteroidota bacterium]